jgi:hypothetical protein
MPRNPLNALLDVWSNLCYTQINVEQDHNFDGDGYRAFYGSGGSCREIMHPLQRAKSKSLSTKLLRQQNLLRDIAKEHGSAVAAAREGRFRSTTEPNLFCLRSAFIKL